MVVLGVTVVAVLVVAGLFAAYIIFRRRSARASAAVGAANPSPPPSSASIEPASAALVAAETVPVSEPAAVTSPMFDLEPYAQPEVAPPVTDIDWFKQFDQRSTLLDETDRLRLIGDLGVIGKEWCVALLCQAYREETRPGNRQAALVALTACRSQTAAETYRLALTSASAQERAIAVDGLAELVPLATPRERIVVERG